MEEGTLVQVHIDKLQMIAYLLTNINHQVFYENLTSTFFESLSSSCHTLVVSVNTHIDQSSMELVCEQLL
jgi:hypothetical protein